MTVQNKRETGKVYEDMAARYLIKQGYRILEQNYRTKQGEIDIVAESDGILVFVEVKHRKDTACGYPEEAVTPAKQKTICRAALKYIGSNHQFSGSPVRFDVIAIMDDEIRHIVNAFDYMG